MDTIASSLARMDLDEASLREYIVEQKENCGFETFYLVDNQGRCFSTDGYLEVDYDRSRIVELVGGGPSVLAASDVPFDVSDIVCTDSIEPVEFNGTELIGAIASFDTSVLGEELVLGRNVGNSHASIIAEDGTYVVGGIGTAGMAAVAVGFVVLAVITATHLPKKEDASRG